MRCYLWCSRVRGRWHWNSLVGFQPVPSEWGLQPVPLPFTFCPPSPAPSTRPTLHIRPLAHMRSDVVLHPVQVDLVA